jgi:DNA-binding transcriptional ArsR family regulator
MKPVGYGTSLPERLGATFMALADPTRRTILARLAENELSVTELAAPFVTSQPAISKHLKVLELAGLVCADGMRSGVRPGLRRDRWQKSRAGSKATDGCGKSVSSGSMRYSMR